jgi:NADH dehydrogenase
LGEARARLKTLADAFTIRARVIGAFEHAERCTDPAAREPWLTFVIIGGGPTGVEMAGTMTEIAQHTLRGEFRRIDPKQTRVVLIEGADRILGTFVPALSQRAAEQLARLGVDVRTGCKVTGIDADGVTYETARAMRPRATGSPHDRDLGRRRRRPRRSAAPWPRRRARPSTAAGRVVVEPDLSLPDHPEISVIGDLAAALSHGKGEPKPVPGVSPGAKQMGRTAARNLLRRLRGEPTQAFRYIDYGNLATVGRKAAVVDLSVPASARCASPACWRGCSGCSRTSTS